MANMSNFNQGGTTNPRFGAGSTGRPDGGTSVTEKAKDTASGVTEKAKDMASSAVETVKSSVSDLKDKAGDIACSIKDQAQHVASDVANRVSDTVESGSHYVQERGIQGMGEDVTGLIRRYPVAAVCVGLCLGF